MLVAGLGVGTGIIAARGLGPVHRGELARLLLWPQLIVGLGTVGLDLAATYFSADQQRRASVPATLLRVAAIQSAALVVLYLACLPLLYGGFGWAPIVMALQIPFDLVALYSAMCLNGLHDYRAFNLIRLAMPTTYAVTLGALAILHGVTATSAALCFLAANGLLALLAFLTLRHRHGLGTPDPKLRRVMLRYGIAGHFGRLSPQSLGLDVVLVSLLLSSKDLGLFVAASAFLAAPRIISTSFSLVIFPHASATHRRGEPAGVRHTIVAAVIAISVGVGFLWVVAGHLVTALLGDSFRASTPILRLLALGEIALAAYVLLIEGLRGIGRAGLTSVIEICSWAAFLAAVSSGAVIGGLEGVAVGVVVASVVGLAALLVLARRSDSLGQLLAQVARPEDVAGTGTEGT